MQVFLLAHSFYRYRSEKFISFLPLDRQKTCNDRTCWKTALWTINDNFEGFLKNELLKTQALGSKAGFQRSEAIIFRQSFQTVIHISTAFRRTLLPPFSRQFNTQSSTARSIKDDQLLDSLSDRCLVAGCLSLESSRCPAGDRYDLASALLDSSEKITFIASRKNTVTLSPNVIDSRHSSSATVLVQYTLDIRLMGIREKPQMDVNHRWTLATHCNLV